MPSDGFTFTTEFNNLRGLDTRTKRETTKAVEASAERVVEDIKANIAVDTGRARGSTHSEPLAEGEAPAGAIGRAVTVDATSDEGFPYPIVLEFGSVKQEARPTMVPAVERERQGYESGIIGAVIKAAEGKGK